MATSNVGSLNVDLSISTARFKKGLDEARGKVSTFQKQMTGVGEKLQGFGTVMSVAVTAPLAALAAKSVEAATESKAAFAQVESALQSMGDASGRTSDQLSALAGKLQDTSLFDDDDIMKKSTANLLTFGKIHGEVFDRAQQAVVDYAARTGTDLQAATIMFGKALNDPIKGLTALSRVGIQFDDSQKAMIKSMVAAGDTAGAQKIILGELEKQYGGAALAARKASPTADMQQAWRTFQETLGAIVGEILPPINNALAGLLNGFNNLSPAMQSTAVAIGAVAAGAGPVAMALGSIMTAIAPLGGAFSAVAGVLGGLSAGVLIPLAAAVGAVYLAWQNWDTVGPMLQGIGEGIVEVFGPPIQQMISTLGEVLSALWNGPLGSLLTSAGRLIVSTLSEAWKQFGPAVVVIVQTLGTVISATMRQIGNVVNVVAALLQGDWSSAWTYAQKIVTDAIAGALEVVDHFVPGATEAMQRLYEGVKTWLQDKLGAVFEWVKGKVQDVGNAFFKLYDAVVGHSYVPDMVDGISEHFGRLQGEMVNPALAACAKVDKAFAAMGASIAAKLPEPVAAGDDTKRDNSGLSLAPATKQADVFAQALQRIQPIFSQLGGEAGSAVSQIVDIISTQLIPSLKGAGEQVGDLSSSFGRLGTVADSVFSAIFGKKAGGIIGSVFNLATSLFSGNPTGGLSAAGSSLGSMVKVPGLASGGSFRVDAAAGADSNVLLAA